jgi:hypothetical protein
MTKRYKQLTMEDRHVPSSAHPKQPLFEELPRELDPATQQ